MTEEKQDPKISPEQSSGEAFVDNSQFENWLEEEVVASPSSAREADVQDSGVPSEPLTLKKPSEDVLESLMNRRQVKKPSGSVKSLFPAIEGDSVLEPKAEAPKEEPKVEEKASPKPLFSRKKSNFDKIDESQIADPKEEEVKIESANDFYKRALQLIYKSEDLGVDATAKANLSEALRENKIPQLAVRELVANKVINNIQLARAMARTRNRREIMSFLDVPPEALDLKSSLDRRILDVLREPRIIPLWKKENDGYTEFHLAYDQGVRNIMIESQLSDMMPRTRFFWHFAMRDVCGAYWLSGSNDENIDSNMEAEALLDRIVATAIDARSSDIHIDPNIRGELKAVLKYRIDGAVQSKEVITQDQLEKLKVRIENLARMPKVNQNHPNKGAFSRAGFDWRVQIQPHSGRQGAVPRIVIRRLQPDVMPMETLGYPEYFIEKIKSAASAANGVIFWTGPTGSGKTESIHSAVVSVNPMGRGLSVHTIEDPPEKRVPGYAVQMEISDMDDARSGMELLKSSLRADPDVIIFGEVRDQEMAELVFEAANTGHLVFTTLHTNTAIDAISRLTELGINGFLLSYIRGITAQRLVRRLCTHCRVPVEEADEYTRYVFERYEVPMEGATLYKANHDGCPSCNYSGYHGRIAIAEWLVPNKELIEATVDERFDELEDIAKRAGWLPMGHMGTLHMKYGITDAEELSDKVLELSTEIS
ncbi:MAG: ATPase, T2SS/T4P/T4SS family [Pseudomonadota bacterium]|nr:ATPase, T2SS/T4P/T4SS family [Pseudomonadota bacterium]